MKIWTDKKLLYLVKKQMSLCLLIVGRVTGFKIIIRLDRIEEYRNMERATILISFRIYGDSQNYVYSGKFVLSRTLLQ